MHKRTFSSLFVSSWNVNMLVVFLISSEGLWASSLVSGISFDSLKANLCLISIWPEQTKENILLLIFCQWEAGNAACLKVQCVRFNGIFSSLSPSKNTGELMLTMKLVKNPKGPHYSHCLLCLFWATGRNMVVQHSVLHGRGPAPYVDFGSYFQVIIS